jgi:hypothetical protein
MEQLAGINDMPFGKATGDAGVTRIEPYGQENEG